MPVSLKTTLRQWRTERGITLEEMADVTGWSVSMLSLIERGERQISPIARIEFARRLGVRVRDIFPVDQRHQLEPSDPVAASA